MNEISLFWSKKNKIQNSIFPLVSPSCVLFSCLSKPWYGFWSNHREKELAAVKINPVDVDVIANELEVTSSTDCTTIYLEVYIPINLCIFLIMSNSWTKRWLKEPCVSIKVMQLLPFDIYFASLVGTNKGQCFRMSYIDLYICVSEYE